MDLSWMTPQGSGAKIDLSWLSKDGKPVRLMFEPPQKPAPEPQTAPAPKPPETPPPPPGPSPEELRLIAECKQMAGVVADALNALQEATQLELNRAAEMVTEIGLCVAEELAAGAIDADENRVLALVKESLELLNAEKDVKVYLTTEMYERLAANGHLEQLRKAHHVTVRPDPRVADRGCIVESPIGQVDARIRSRLRQLRHLIAEKQGTRES